ncbi:MAG: response regulator [Phycisphaerales bacterium]
MSYKVLLADDDLAFLKSMTVRLRAEGFEVVSVQDGYQAVELARKTWPDVLVLDINMPAGEGFTVTQRVDHIAHLEGIPIIYLTGERSARVDRLAKDGRAFTLLHKPFDTDALLAAITDAVEAPRLLRPVRVPSNEELAPVRPRTIA